MKKREIVNYLCNLSRRLESRTVLQNEILDMADTIDRELMDRTPEQKPRKTPSWDDAPATATHRLVHPFGIMYFHNATLMGSQLGSYPIEQRPEKPKAPELKPCPLCGSKLGIRNVRFDDSVTCAECGCSASYFRWQDRT